MGVAATWLPPELTTVQPYSMSPLLRCPPDRSRPCTRPFVIPAMGSSVRIDAAEMFIRACFVAPASVQRRSFKGGETALMMIRPTGLLEALGLAEGAPSVADRVDALMTPEDRIEAAQSFVDALMALEDED